MPKFLFYNIKYTWIFKVRNKLTSFGFTFEQVLALCLTLVSTFCATKRLFSALVAMKATPPFCKLPPLSILTLKSCLSRLDVGDSPLLLLIVVVLTADVGLLGFAVAMISGKLADAVDTRVKELAG